jgi:hypothetical protein
MTSNHPVYRARPGQHSPRCRCNACWRANTARTKPGLLAFDLIAVAALFVIAGITWVALAPLRIWHKTGADGQMHPVTATYVAYLAGAVVIVAPLVFFSVRATRRSGRA